MISKKEGQETKSSRTIEKWAGLYDLVNFFVFLIFGGADRLHKDIIEMAEIKESHIILDMGCGTGELLIKSARQHRSIKGYGIDASYDMIFIAEDKLVSKNYSNIHFEVSLAERLPYGNDRFDNIFNIFLLHHLPADAKSNTLKEARRVLKPKGALLLVDIDKPTSFLGRLIGMSRHNVEEVRQNMEQPLEDLLRDAGFSETELLRKDYGIFSFIRCRK